MNQETPETDAMLETDWHRLEEYSAPLSAYKRMTELCREMERERDRARRSAEGMRTSFLRLAGGHPDCIKYDWENAKHIDRHE